MKRHGNLYEKIYDMDNLRYAFKRASQHKHSKPYVKEIEDNLDYYLTEIQTSLKEGTYKTAPYRTKYIYEPKKRLIYILPFYPDRIVHHAIMNVLEPIWDNLMYYHSYACRKGKGQHRGSRVCAEYVRKYKYCLQCDVSKFYPSINHAILKKIIRKKIKDERLLVLLDKIIDSVEGEKNVPIGNYLSQWFGNIYLNELDTRAKDVYKSKAYVRFCDDFLFFSSSKDELNAIKRDLSTWLGDTLGLTLSECSLFPTSQGVDFLGYRHFPNKILLRKSTAKRDKKKVIELWDEVNNNDNIDYDKALSIIQSMRGWMKHAQSHNLNKAMKLDELLEVVENGRQEALFRLCENRGA